MLKRLIIQEKEMKATADATLGEVRRKIHETQRTLDLMQALLKLRQLRKVAEEKRGQYS